MLFTDMSQDYHIIHCPPLVHFQCTSGAAGRRLHSNLPRGALSLAHPLPAGDACIAERGGPATHITHAM
jgi:hypothetical protein